MCERQRISVPTVYLTAEQIHRLAGLACDARIGIQIHTDARDESPVTCEFVPKRDDPGGDYLRFFTIRADGSCIETT